MRAPLGAALLAAAVCLAAPLEASAASGPCRQFSIAGEVRDGQSYTRPISRELSFRLTPSGRDDGWSFEIGPTTPRKDEFDTYVYALNPPYRFRLSNALDTSYAMLAQEAVSAGSEHSFWFLTRRADGELASKALSAVLWPQTDAAQDEGLETLAWIPMAHGTLRMHSVDVVSGPLYAAKTDSSHFYGQIHRMSFTVKFVVPTGFGIAPELKSTASTCEPENTAWLRDWSQDRYLDRPNEKASRPDLTAGLMAQAWLNGLVRARW